MQLLTVTGNLGGDAELKTTNAGKSFYKFSVAANTKKDGKDETTWYNVVLFGDFWKGVSQYLVKGTKVMVVGDYSFRTYEKDGKTGYSHDLKGDKLELIGGKKEDGSFNHGANANKSDNPFES